MTWQLEQSNAHLKSDNWDVSVSLGADSPLISVNSAESRNASTTPQTLSLPTGVIPPFGDSYVRHADLIAHYPQTDDSQFSFQLDVKLVEDHADRLCLEMWASVQTFLLDSYPAIQWQLDANDDSKSKLLTSDYNVDGSFTLSEIESPTQKGSRVGVVLDSVVSQDQSNWCLMIDPRDEQETELISSHNTDAAYAIRLFGGFMEKGVIRRARLRWLISNAGLDRNDIESEYRRLCESPLPLTT